MAVENSKFSGETATPLVVDIDKYFSIGDGQPALLINPSASLVDLLVAAAGRIDCLEKMANLFACSEDEDMTKIGEIFHPRAQELRVMMVEITNRARSTCSAEAGTRSLN